MKVISFNTFLAPTMTDRYRRATLIASKITQWLDDDVDIIGLQEVNSMTIGPLGYIWLRMELYLYCWVELQRIIDMFLIMEGYILPLHRHCISHIIEDAIDAHDKKYIYLTSDQPTRGVNNGLMTIMKCDELVDYHTLDLPSDFIHTPGMLCIKYNALIISNVHFIPILPDTNYVYKCVNYINYLFGHNIINMQLQSIDIVRDVISMMATEVDNEVIALGDFNIGKRDGSDLYDTLLTTLDVIDTATDVITTHHPLGIDDNTGDQIDYIFTNCIYQNRSTVVQQCVNLSDHHPIHACI
jgi:hypothetical protein